MVRCQLIGAVLRTPHDASSVRHRAGKKGLVDSYRYLGRRKRGNPASTIDFMLTAMRDRDAASRFLCKAIDQCGTPQKIIIDKSGAYTAAIEEHNAANKILFLFSTFLSCLKHARANRVELGTMESFPYFYE